MTCWRLQILQPSRGRNSPFCCFFSFFLLFLCFLKQNSQTRLLQKLAGVCSHSVSWWGFLDEKVQTNKRKLHQQEVTLLMNLFYNHCISPLKLSFPCSKRRGESWNNLGWNYLLFICTLGFFHPTLDFVRDKKNQVAFKLMVVQEICGDAGEKHGV